MKKILTAILCLMMITGCSKSVSVPKLHAKTIDLNYGDQISLDYNTLLNLDGFSDEEIEELEKNGEIDSDTLTYDESGNIAPGSYEVEISYYSDVVDTVINVTNPALPVLNVPETIDVPWSYLYFDYTPYVTASSPVGAEINITYDTSAIDYYTVGQYNMVVSVNDSLGNVVSKNVTVNVYQ